MCQSYAAWLRGEINSCTNPWVMNAVIIPHAEDVAAIYRRQIAETVNPGIRQYLVRCLNEFEQLIENARGENV